MCSSRICRSLLILLALILLIRNTGHTQTTPGAQQPNPNSESGVTLPATTKDPQAVTVVSQALSAAGITNALTAISDYTGTGSITDYRVSRDNPVQGTVTVSGQGLQNFRMDTTEPQGQNSEIIAGAWTTKDPSGNTTTIHRLPPLSPARLFMPYLQLGVALTSKNLNLVDKGMVELNGSSFRDVQVQRVFPNMRANDKLNVDFYIDPTTSHVVMMGDVYENQPRNVLYSNFTVTNNILVPLSITETIGQATLWIINLSQITFNSGLQASTFKF